MCVRERERERERDPAQSHNFARSAGAGISITRLNRRMKRSPPPKVCRLREKKCKSLAASLHKGDSLT